MANIIYNRGHADCFRGAKALDTASYRMLLVRSTSTYTPDKDHDFLSDLFSGGLVEISVASYSRKTISGITITADDAGDAVRVTFSDVDFGSLESGQTVKAIVIYRHETDDNDSVPLVYLDTDTAGLLPRALGDAPFIVASPSTGFLVSSQA